MSTNSKHSQRAQFPSSLPLLAWPSVVVQPTTRAGQFVARRYGVAPAVADLVANLAGLGSEVR